MPRLLGDEVSRFVENKGKFWLTGADKNQPHPEQHRQPVSEVTDNEGCR
jgi:hypothetical protein